MASTYISLPAQTFSGSVSVNLDASTDSVAIGDGIDLLSINPDGSINVNVGGNAVNTFNEITSVASSGLFTTVVSYMAPSPAKLKFVSVAGSNVAEYQVKINGSIQSKKYTYFGGALSADFDFRDGIDLVGSDLVTVEVRHNRTDLGNFNGNIIIQI